MMKEIAAIFLVSTLVVLTGIGIEARLDMTYVPTSPFDPQINTPTYTYEPLKVIYGSTNDYFYLSIQEKRVGFHNTEGTIHFTNQGEYIGEIIPTASAKHPGNHKWYMCPLINPEVTSRSQTGNDYEKTLVYSGFKYATCYEYDNYGELVETNITINEMSIKCTNEGRCKISSDISFTQFVPEDTGFGYIFVPRNMSKFRHITYGSTTIDLNDIGKISTPIFSLNLKFNSTNSTWSDVAVWNWNDMLYPETAVNYSVIKTHFEVLEVGDRRGLLTGTYGYGNLTRIIIDPTYEITNITLGAIHVNTTQEGGGQLAHLNLNDSDLLLYMPFDVENTTSTVYDWSSNNQDGTISGNVRYNTSGKYGSCYEFDGTSDHIDTGVFPFGGSDTITIALWIYPDDWDVTDARLISKNDAGGGVGKHSPMLSHYTNPFRSLRVRLDIGSTQTHFSDIDFFGSSSANEVGRWMHIAMVYNGTNIIYYKNGTQFGSMDSQSGNIDYDATYELWIGANPTDGYGGFDGRIDEVMIWNRSLSATEIQQLYYATFSRFYPYGNHTISPENNSNENNNRVNVTVHHSNQNGTNTNLSMRLGYYNFSFSDDILMYSNFEFDEIGDTGSAFDISLRRNSGNIFSTDVDENGLNGSHGITTTANDYITYSDNNLVEDVYEFTVSIWVKSNSGSSDSEQFIGKHGTGVTTFRLHWENTENIEFLVDGSDGTGYEASYTDGITDTNWHHVVGRYNGTHVAVFVDNIQGDQITAMTDKTDISTKDLRIATNSDLDKDFGGRVDEAMLINRSLTLAEIEELFLMGAYTRYYTAYQNLTSDTEAEYTVDVGADFIFPEIIYYSDSNQHWSPILENITMETWNYTALVVDVTDPVVTLVHPSDDAIETTSTIVTFTFNVSDSGVIDNCTLYIKNDTTNATHILLRDQLNVLPTVCDNPYSYFNGTHVFGICGTENFTANPAESDTDTDYTFMYDINNNLTFGMVRKPFHVDREACAWNGSLFACVGGENGTSRTDGYLFNPTENTTTFKSGLLPNWGIFRAKACSNGTHVWVMGGRNDSAGDVGDLNDIYRWNLATDSIVDTGNDLPGEAYSYGLVIDVGANDERCFIINGKNNSITFDSIVLFNKTSETASEVATSPTATYGTSGVLAGNTIIVAPGVDTWPPGFLDYSFKFDIDTYAVENLTGHYGDIGTDTQVYDSVNEQVISIGGTTTSGWVSANIRSYQLYELLSNTTTSPSKNQNVSVEYALNDDTDFYWSVNCTDESNNMGESSEWNISLNVVDTTILYVSDSFNYEEAVVINYTDIPVLNNLTTSDSITYGESAKTDRTWYTDTITINMTDSVTYGEVLNITTVDIGNFYLRSITDSIIYGDTVSYNYTNIAILNNITVADSITYEESVITNRTWAQDIIIINLTDSLTYDEQISTNYTQVISVVIYNVSVTDSVTYGEALNITFIDIGTIYSRFTTDNLNYGEYVSYNYTDIVTLNSLNVVDLLTYSESISTNRTWAIDIINVSVTDGLTYDETINTTRISLGTLYLRTVEDSMNYGELGTRILYADVAVQDILSYGEITSLSKTLTIRATEYMTYGEHVTRSKPTYVNVMDFITYGEIVNGSYTGIYIPLPEFPFLNLCLIIDKEEGWLICLEDLVWQLR